MMDLSVSRNRSFSVHWKFKLRIQLYDKDCKIDVYHGGSEHEKRNEYVKVSIRSNEIHVFLFLGCCIVLSEVV